MLYLWADCYVRRRQFLILIGSATQPLWEPFAARAERAGKPPVIGLIALPKSEAKPTVRQHRECVEFDPHRVIP
jgi:hypothetical protein